MFRIVASQQEGGRGLWVQVRLIGDSIVGVTVSMNGCLVSVFDWQPAHRVQYPASVSRDIIHIYSIYILASLL